MQSSLLHTVKKYCIDFGYRGMESVIVWFYRVVP